MIEKETEFGLDAVERERERVKEKRKAGFKAHCSDIVVKRNILSKGGILW